MEREIETLGTDVSSGPEIEQENPFAISTRKSMDKTKAWNELEYREGIALGAVIGPLFIALYALTSRFGIDFLDWTWYAGAALLIAGVIAYFWVAWQKKKILESVGIA